MCKNPLVSIITPCYNSEAFIQRYLNSILAQTYSQIQLILVNDGSSDKTEELIDNYRRGFEDKGYEITYVFQENAGLGAAINTGLKLIKGDFFTWCDPDNFFDSTYVRKNVDFFLKEPDYSIVRCDGYRVNEGDISTLLGKFSDKTADKFNEDLFMNMLLSKDFYFGCTMLKTSSFDVVNPDREIYPSRHGQNYQLMLPMFYKYKSGYIDEPLFYFVNRADSLAHAEHVCVEKNINQLEEYATIIRETINHMDIDHDKKDYYIGLANCRLYKKCFNLALEAEKLDLVDCYYRKLSKNDGIGAKIRVKYAISKNSALLKLVLYIIRR